MAVIGAPGTTINGSKDPFVTSRAVTTIVANLNTNSAGVVGAGSTIGSFAYTGGAASINSGAGDDLIEFGNSTVGLNTVIDAGSGNDYVFSTALTTRYNLFVYLGAGDDVLALNNARAFAAFLYGGTGANTLYTNGPTRTNVGTLRYFQFQTVINVV